MKDLDAQKIDDFSFVSLGSGSSGNSSILIYKETMVMLDAGVPYWQMLKQMKELGIVPEMLSAVLVTHDHADHIRSVSKMALNHFLPVYCSAPVARAMLTHKYARPELAGYLKRLPQEEPLRVGEMTIEYFDVPHDATHNVGYTITTPAGVFSLITDIGSPTEKIRAAIRKSNFLVLESNYDEQMLLEGRYPIFLKERIASGWGHISNKEAVRLLSDNYHDGLKFVALCHLSKDNNRPEIALQTVREQMWKLGVCCDKDLELQVLQRHENSPVFRLKR
ncbi:MAG: MBL fold metallo-hydrolase [Porphyromonas sp.]|nr:MBL fold metallo-hydrolase [Porphyromonas sp.]